MSAEQSNDHYRLVIGNKNTSSWSLRPWIAMRRAGIAFSEINVNLRDPDAKAQILAHSPSGKVPALHAGNLMVWDSLAILEYLAETHPDAGLWPSDKTARAIARSVAAEMHSGFQPLRANCPMDLLARAPRQDLPEDVAKDVRRIIEIWRDARLRFGAGGPFLFGRFSAVDAMYAPVASRFRTYLADLEPFGDDGTARDYIDAMFATQELQDWEAGAKAQMSV